MKNALSYLFAITLLVLPSTSLPVQKQTSTNPLFTLGIGAVALAGCAFGLKILYTWSRDKIHDKKTTSSKNKPQVSTEKDEWIIVEKTEVVDSFIEQATQRYGDSLILAHEQCAQNRVNTSVSYEQLVTLARYGSYAASYDICIQHITHDITKIQELHSILENISDREKLWVLIVDLTHLLALLEQHQCYFKLCDAYRSMLAKNSRIQCAAERAMCLDNLLGALSNAHAYRETVLYIHAHAACQSLLQIS